MNKERLQKYREQLSAMAAQIGKTTAGLEREVLAMPGGDGDEVISAPPQPGEIGSDVYLQELGATLLENEQFIRAEIDAALARLDAKSYGQCESCGKPIPDERLDVLPYARHCTPCAATLQGGQR